MHKRLAFGAVSLCAALAACFLTIDESKLDPGAGDAGGEEAGRDAASDVDAAVTLPGLVAYWPLDGTDPTHTADTSGHGHDATIVGTPNRVDGVRGSALFFGNNGAPTQYLEVLSLYRTAFPQVGTVSMWLRYDTGGGRASFFDVDIADADVRSNVYLVLDYNQHATVVSFLSPDNDAGVSISAPLGVWMHVVAAWDGPKAIAHAYVGALHQPLVEYPVPHGVNFAPTSEYCAIGAGLFGILDEIQLYDHALDLTDAQRLHF